MQNYKLGFTLKISLKKDDSFFGYGIAQLLQLVLQTNSLNEASKIIGISYGKTWRIIKKAEQELGFKLLIRKAGGTNGGGSVLTEEGSVFLERYLYFVGEMNRYALPLFNECFDCFIKMDNDNERK
jgi:molybdate transport system regulatory protein